MVFGLDRSRPPVKPGRLEAHFVCTWFRSFFLANWQMEIQSDSSVEHQGWRLRQSWRIPLHARQHVLLLCWKPTEHIYLKKKTNSKHWRIASIGTRDSWPPTSAVPSCPHPLSWSWMARAQLAYPNWSNRGSFAFTRRPANWAPIITGQWPLAHGYRWSYRSRDINLPLPLLQGPVERLERPISRLWEDQAH